MEAAEANYRIRQLFKEFVSHVEAEIKQKLRQ